MTKYIIIALYNLVLNQVFSFLFYSIIFHQYVVQFMVIYRPMTAWQWIILPLFGLWDGIMYGTGYFWLKKHIPNIKPLHFTLIYALLTRVAYELMIYATFPSTIFLSFSGMLVSVSCAISVAFLLHFINKK